MHVEDLLSPMINITVGITKEDAENFKEMCNTFASSNLHKHAVDQYVLNLSELRSQSNLKHMFSMKESVTVLSDASVQSLQKFKAEIDKNNDCDSLCSKNTDNIDMSSNTNATRLMPNRGNSLEHFIKIDEISQFSQIEMEQLLSSSKSRMDNEMEIIYQLELLARSKGFHSAIAAVRAFGSVTFGFGGHKTNFNVSIIAGSKKNPKG